MTQRDTPSETTRGRRISRWAIRIAALVIAVPLVLLVAVYLRLLFGPLPVAFFNEQARDTVLSALPPGYQIELGEIALVLEGSFSPVVRATPVNVTERNTGATIKMDALDVGFSPFRALIGQPGAAVTLIGPHIQMVQDLFGPRASTFELVAGEDGQRPVIRVQQGEAEYPVVGILGQGLDVRSGLPEAPELTMRSDNDLLINNFKALETALESVLDQARQGRFSRLTIREGTLELHDTVYALLRRFSDIEFEIAPTPDGQGARGKFSAQMGRFVTTGVIERRFTPDGRIVLDGQFDNLDFATLLPFLDDPDALFAVQGAGTLDAQIYFNTETRKVLGAQFVADIDRLDFRIGQDRFPVEADDVHVSWRPDDARFVLADTAIRIGDSSAEVSGIFAPGLDDTFGPTMGISASLRNVYIRPADLPAPATPFDEITFRGWSAPLYGATGIDSLVATKQGVTVSVNGRLDVLRYGTGISATVTGAGASADDLKRLWPYFMSTEARTWFIEHVASGYVQNSSMQFEFPVGSIGKPEDDLLILDNSVSIDIEGAGVRLALIEGMEPIPLAGRTRVEVQDNVTSVTVSGGELDSGEGPVAFANGSFIMESHPEASVFEISGDVASTIPSLVALASQQSPELLERSDLPFNPGVLYGDLNAQVVATVSLDGDGDVSSIDYAFTGTMEEFGSSEPIQTHTIDEGALDFTATTAGYRITGEAVVDGLQTDLVLQGILGGSGDMLVSARIDAAELKSLGFDVTNFLSGPIEFVGRPLADGAIQLAADLKDASVFIHDLGIEKAPGVAGTFNAQISQSDGVTELTQVDLSFADVNLEGSLSLSDANGLERAEFTQIAVSPGDSARMLLERQESGYKITVRGEQLDLKPTLRRFFGLGEGQGGPQATQFDHSIVIDVQLGRGLGFYRTTAYDLSMALTINGTDLRDVAMTALLGDESRVSVTTNPGGNGAQTMSVAFNDAGTLLRLLGVYPRLLGGSGSLVLVSTGDEQGDAGRFEISNFSIVDENKVVEILGNHPDSREIIAAENRVSFSNGLVEFVRHPDRIEVQRGILTGALVGGSMQGTIYTEAREYDLIGTYVPFFGVNNVFQQLPILGILLGGREGEGLIGVTFAVRGNLDNPDFLVNPVSALMPGVLRLFMDFQQSDGPRGDGGASETDEP